MEAVTGVAGRSWRSVAARWGRAEPCADATDAAVLAAIAAGDGGALGEIYRRHARALFSYLLRVCGDRMMAEEVLQDTLLAVWRGAATFQARSSVRTWLFAVARRQAYQRLRLQPAPVPVEPADVADSALGPDELAMLASGGTAVAGAIARLAEHHRDVIGLAMVAGLPLAEVAEIIGVPIGTVKSRLFHGRAALARMLAKEDRSP